MSALIDVSQYGPTYSRSLSEYFSDQINANTALFMETILNRGISLYLEEARKLAKLVILVAENPIPIRQDSIDCARNCLRFMQEILKDEKNLGWSDEQKAELEPLYLDIAGAVSKIVIQNSIFGFPALS